MRIEVIDGESRKQTSIERLIQGREPGGYARAAAKETDLKNKKLRGIYYVIFRKRSSRNA
jgi:hypothetical protein